MFLRILFLVLAALPAAAETYIIPIWAISLQGSDGIWATRVTAVNPNPMPVSYQVTGVYPLQSEPCQECTGVSGPVTIEPGAAVPLNPRGHLPGSRMTAGAFAIETSAPLAIHLVAYRSGRSAFRQYLSTARRWLPAGRHRISTVEPGGTDWRMNLFVVNPRDTPVTVTAWAGPREENERRRIIPPHSTAIVAVGPPLCNGVRCPSTTEFPPALVSVEIETDGEVLTSISSLTSEWAVFSLADQARE